MDMRVIVLVTGESCAGKDYCATIWASELRSKGYKSIRASISDATKKEYAIVTGADLQRLLNDRAYKEQHRPALSDFYQAQVQQRPCLPDEHFLQVVQDKGDVDILFITGLRDDAPVAIFSPLVPGRRLLEVRVQASKEIREARGAAYKTDELRDHSHPDFIHENNKNFTGHCEVDCSMTSLDTKIFGVYNLLPLLDDEVRQLANMVRSVSDFPSMGIMFRHVLNIFQEQNGIGLCTELIRDQFRGDIQSIDVVVACETGGLLFASAFIQGMLGYKDQLRMVLVRKQGKLPPPLLSTRRSLSHISSLESSVAAKGMFGWMSALWQQMRRAIFWELMESDHEAFEMEAGEISSGDRVLVMDDVLATGNTLCAVLGLLVQAGVDIEKIHIVVVAEFPIHGGRGLLHQRGYGRVRIQSLLVFDGF